MSIRDRILTVHNGSRHDARRVLFLILNKEPTVGINIWQEAKALRGDGVEIFVLYVDRAGTDLEKLQAIASEPAESHFFAVRDFEDLGFLAYETRSTGKSCSDLVFEQRIYLKKTPSFLYVVFGQQLNLTT